jgi:hypothetical protein
LIDFMIKAARAIVFRACSIMTLAAVKKSGGLPHV